MAARAILAFLFTALLAGQALAAEINLSAAASLREVITALSGSYAKANGEVGFRTNFGASGALAKQIANGAPADIFLSANTEWMDYLKARGPLSVRGIIAGSVLMFARGLGEFGATVIVAGNIPGVTQTIPLAIYEYAGSPPETMPWRSASVPYPCRSRSWCLSSMNGSAGVS